MSSSLKSFTLGVLLPGLAAPLVLGSLFASMGSDDRPRLEELERLEVRLAPTPPAAPAAPVVTVIRTKVGCAYTREVEGTVAGDVRVLRLTSGSGDVSVVGRDGLDEVRMTAVLCASSSELLDELTARVEGRGDRVEVSTGYPDRSGWWSGDAYARIDLSVEVPRGTAVDVEDGSGSITLSDVGSATVDDGSGDVEIRGAAGSVQVDDGSGGILVRGVTGDVVIDDGSGGVEVANVGGAVRIDDGSGPLRVFDVRSDVRVRDGSGDIDVTAVRGSLTVEEDGSGGLEWSDVAGRVEVPQKHARR